MLAGRIEPSQPLQSQVEESLAAVAPDEIDDARAREYALLAALLVSVRLALAKLLLRSGNKPEVMLGVLIIVLGRDRISGTLRISG